VLAMQPHLETAVVQTLVGDGFALSHSRWHLVLSENGSRSELPASGRWSPAGPRTGPGGSSSTTR
jgi:hypothetical protein